MRLVVKLASLALIGIFFVGCATPNAAYERGFTAGQAKEKTKTVANNLQDRFNFVVKEKESLELQILEKSVAEERQIILEIQDPVVIHNQTWESAMVYVDNKLAIIDVNARERTENTKDYLSLLELAEVPLDINKMADSEDAARSKFAKETATQAIALGTQIMTQYETRQKEIKAEKDMKKREDALKEKEAEIERAKIEAEMMAAHEEPAPAAPVAPAVTTTVTTGS